MARRWRNYTDLPDEELKAIYAAVLPSGLPGHDIEIKNCAHGPGRGMAYTRGSSYHATARPFIVVSVPKTERAARHVWPGGDGYLPHVTGSRREVFVYILAHELRHLQQAQAKTRLRGMVWGARGRFSERDCDAHAIQIVRRYRRGELATTRKKVQ